LFNQLEFEGWIVLRHGCPLGWTGCPTFGGQFTKAERFCRQAEPTISATERLDKHPTAQPTRL
ncbi:hypothetical protein, partial [Pseudomonas abietaniphila]|uniref:hypothetical protein n=1 Tax=Pseudomonas abietaniphila TaxID=89065 RepID=UPI001ABFB5A8